MRSNFWSKFERINGLFLTFFHLFFPYFLSSSTGQFFDFFYQKNWGIYFEFFDLFLVLMFYFYALLYQYHLQKLHEVFAMLLCKKTVLKSTVTQSLLTKYITISWWNCCSFDSKICVLFGNFYFKNGALW